MRMAVLPIMCLYTVNIIYIVPQGALYEENAKILETEPICWQQQKGRAFGRTRLKEGQVICQNWLLGVRGKDDQILHLPLLSI